MKRRSLLGLSWILVTLLVGSGCERPSHPTTTAKAATSEAGSVPDRKVEAPAAGQASAVVEAPKRESGRTVVVWISVDGMRGDYVNHAKTPFLHRMMKEGAYTRKMLPIFPSLTFPSHVAQVTGANVNQHGIILNAIYDARNDRRWSYPNVASEILCEPIWTTVKRGGRRVMVYDWPVSQQQTGEFKADYFDQAFDAGLSDEERLNRLLDTWSKDDSDSPLQLIMGYVSAPDKAGHKYGPNTAETKDAVEKVDDLLDNFFKRVQKLFSQKMNDSDTLYFLLTTDHGMDDVKVILNLHLMCGGAWTDEMRMVASGSVGNIFLERLGPPPARKPHVQKILEVLKSYDFAHAYAREALPKKWAYDHPTRTGDVVVSLDTGYMFSEKEGPAMRSIDPGDGPLGMHGYPPAENPHMLGFLAIWKSGTSLGGVELGKVDSRRLHATVAKWLDVKPAETAVQEVIELP